MYRVLSVLALAGLVVGGVALFSNNAPADASAVQARQTTVCSCDNCSCDCGCDVSGVCVCDVCECCAAEVAANKMPCAGGSCCK